MKSFINFEVLQVDGLTFELESDMKSLEIVHSLHNDIQNSPHSLSCLLNRWFRSSLLLNFILQSSVLMQLNRSLMIYIWFS